MDQRANTKVYQAWKVTEREAGSAALRVVSFMAFMPLPQAWGMLAPFIWSWQTRRVDKDHTTVTRCGAGALGQEFSRRMVLSGPTFPEDPTDTPGSGTTGHITSWAPGDRPLPCCCLFTGFQGSRLPSLETSMTGPPAAEGSCRTV